MNLFLLNFFFYFITAIFFWRRDRRLTFRVVVFALFSLFAFMSYYTVLSGIYFQQFGNFGSNTLSVVPFIINYVMIIVITDSMKGYEKINVYYRYEFLNFKIIKYIELFVIFISLLFFGMNIIAYKILSSFDLGEIYSSLHEGENVLRFPAQWMNIAYFRSQQIIQVIYPFMCICEFTKLVNGTSVKKCMTILMLVFIPQIISCALLANRAGIIFTTASFVFFIIFFWPYLNFSIKRKIKIGACVFLLLIISSLVVISYSRASNSSEDSINDAIRYFGESFPNLGYRIWDVNGKYLVGMRMYPSIYGMFHTLPIELQENNTKLIHYFLGDISGFPIINFKTFYGDLYCEWGPFVPFLFVFGYVFLAKFMFIKLRNSIFSIVIIYYTFNLLIWGMFGAHKLNEVNLEQLLWNFIIALCLSKIDLNRT